MIKYPYCCRYNQLQYKIFTSATTGNISTQYFGEKFNSDKVDGHVKLAIFVFVPPYLKRDKNVSLMFDIKKNTMMEVSDNDQILTDIVDDIDANVTHLSKNFTAPSPNLNQMYFQLSRTVPEEEISKMELDSMPGFKLTWKYNKHVDQMNIEDKYDNKNKRIEFTR